MQSWVWYWFFVSHVTLLVLYIVLETNLASIAYICPKTSLTSLGFCAFCPWWFLFCSWTWLYLWPLLCDLCRGICVIFFFNQKNPRFHISFKRSSQIDLKLPWKGEERHTFYILSFTVYINIWFWPILISTVCFQTTRTTQ